MTKTRSRIHGKGSDDGMKKEQYKGKAGMQQSNKNVGMDYIYRGQLSQ